MENIKSIQKQCLERKISVPIAVDRIDETIGGITSCVLKNEKKFKIYNHDEIYSLKINGLRKKQLNILYGIAVLAYFKALQNNSNRPGEVHISRKASTKHYMPGIKQILNKYQ
tara:strand:+ start:6784 stop:7122 length:339 start_codon:yes stop_codon:yes gene_type:complete